MTDEPDEERPRLGSVDSLDVAIRPVAAPRLPVRALVTGLLAVAVLVAAPALLGRRTGTTPHFGPARNGLIIWALGGDITAGDPITGATKPVIVGAGIDRNPRYSRDGTRLVFLRQVPTDQGRFDLFVSAADGSGLVMVSAVPMTMPTAVDWTPDGDALLVDDADGRLFRYSIYGSPRRLLVDGVHLDADASRPPDGAEILYERVAEPGALYLMTRDGTRARELVGPTAETCSCTLAGPARWSPDGRSIAFAIALDGTASRVFVMEADGTGLRRLTDESRAWMETDPTWSPIGDRIAFNRWQRDDAGDWQARPIGIVAAAGGPLEPIGVAPAAEGALIEWSPDGRSILSLPKTLIDAYRSYPNGTGSVARPVILDIAAGSSRQPDWSVGSIASWQRQAP
jgi:Tol biopolymer transport system component